MTGGALEASVTLEELCAILGTKRVPMAPELAGYIALEIAERADPSAGDIDTRSVFLGDEGTVALVQPKRDNPTGDAETSVRAALARLLESSGSQTPALAAASRRKSGVGLPGLAAELESALIPVNRAAGRRALARLAREIKRATLGLGRHTLPSSSEVSSRSSSRSLPSPVDPGPESGASSSPQTTVDSLIAQFGVSSEGEQGLSRELRAIAGISETPSPPSSVPLSASPSNDPVSSDGGDTTLEAHPWANPHPRYEHALESDASARVSVRRPWRRGTIVLGSIACLGCALAFAVHLNRRNNLAGFAGGSTSIPIPLTSYPVPPCRGLVVVSDVPARAEVLVRVGKAPLDVDRMPVGARLEFVATANSFIPKRIVVPASALWDPGADRVPRFTASVELEHSLARSGTNDPWPAGEPGSEVGGQGSPGIVRLLVTPVGADLWMLSGLGPEARIERACDRTTDILVAGPTTFRKELRVSSGDFAPISGDGSVAAQGPLQIARVSAR